MSKVKQSEQPKTEDPLNNPNFKDAGFFEKLREILLGSQRPLECAQIEVTSFCPGECGYCPHTTQSASWRSRHMPADIFARIWPLLKHVRRAHLQGWGEPLLHPRFFDFAELAIRAGCQVSTTTCGLAMNESIAERIVASGMDMIAFSLAGTDAVSNAIRENVDFAKVCGAIETLRRACAKAPTSTVPEIHLAYILLADRMEAAANLPRLMEELDVPVAVVSTLDYLALPEQKNLAIRPGENDKIAKAAAILEAAAQEASLAGRAIHYALPGPEPVAMRGGCRENIARCMYIDADGLVSPCVYLNVPGSDGNEKRCIFGNIAETEPLAIWRKGNYTSFRKKLLDNEPDQACIGCPKRQEIFVEANREE